MIVRTSSVCGAGERENKKFAVVLAAADCQPSSRGMVCFSRQEQVTGSCF